MNTLEKRKAFASPSKKITNASISYSTSGNVSNEKNDETHFHVSSIQDYFPTAHKAVRQGSRYTHPSHPQAQLSFFSLLHSLFSGRHHTLRVRAFGNRKDLFLSHIFRWLYPSNYFNHLWKMIVIIFASVIFLDQIVLPYLMTSSTNQMMIEADNSSSMLKCDENDSMEQISFCGGIRSYWMSSLWVMRSFTFIITTLAVGYCNKEVLLSMLKDKVWMNPKITNVRLSPCLYFFLTQNQ